MASTGPPTWDFFEIGPAHDALVDRPSSSASGPLFLIDVPVAGRADRRKIVFTRVVRLLLFTETFARDEEVAAL